MGFFRRQFLEVQAVLVGQQQLCSGVCSKVPLAYKACAERFGPEGTHPAYIYLEYMDMVQ